MDTPLHQVLLNILRESLDEPANGEAVVVCVSALRRGRILPENLDEVLERLRALNADPEWINIERLIKYFEGEVERAAEKAPKETPPGGLLGVILGQMRYLRRFMDGDTPYDAFGERYKAWLDTLRQAWSTGLLSEAEVRLVITTLHELRLDRTRARLVGGVTLTDEVLNFIATLDPNGQCTPTKSEAGDDDLSSSDSS